MNFEEKVRSLKASELVLAMVEGLENHKYEVDMDTFGRTREGVCYGCAATNAIAQLAGKAPRFAFKVPSERTWAKAIKGSEEFIRTLEFAFNNLRFGDLSVFNGYAKLIQVKEIPVAYGESLPGLENNNWHEGLPAYRKLAKRLQEAGL